MPSSHLPALLSLLSREYGASPADFRAEENILTLPGTHPVRFSEHPPFFRMCTLGKNAVITAHASLHPFLRSFIEGRDGHFLFEHQNLQPLERELNRFGYRLGQSFHQYLPQDVPSASPDASLTWLSEEEWAPLQSDPRFSNAFSEEPTRLAVCVKEGERILGIAACSSDAPGWMQIGVDVLPAHRGRGIGRRLVSAMRDAIRAQGAVPYYGTSLSNLDSQNLALRAGFLPAWVEIFSERME